MSTGTVTTAAVSLAFLCCAAQATAQSVEVRVKISPEVARELNRIVTSVVPDVQREIGGAVRAIAQEVATARKASGAFGQNRAFAAEQTQRETRRLQLGATGSIDLRNVSGDITVTAGTGREVTVEIVRVSRGRTDADAKLGLDRVTVAVDQRGERATVEARYPDERGRSNYHVSVSYTVTAPVGTHVTASSIAGNIVVTGIHGDIATTDVGGNVTLSDAGRVTSAKTVGGSVTITGAQSDGNLEAGTIGGSVTLERIKARRVAVNVISGNVTARDITCDGADVGTFTGTVDFSGPLARNGRYELHSQSGTVRFSPSNDTGFELQANTFSGEIRTEFALRLQGTIAGRGPRRSVRGTYGDGSAVVIATTFSGNVIVTKK